MSEAHVSEAHASQAHGISWWGGTMKSELVLEQSEEGWSVHWSGFLALVAVLTVLRGRARL